VDTPHNASLAPAQRPPTEAPKRSRTRTRLIVVGIIGALLVVAAVAGFFVLDEHRGDQALAEAIAEADQLDPGWRLEDLEASRKPVAAETDSAPLIGRTAAGVIALLNRGTSRQDLQALQEELAPLKPPTALTEAQTEKLRACLVPFVPHIVEARKIADLPEGRFPSNVKATLSWTVSNVDQANLIVWLLLEEAILRLQDGDADGAWRSCQAALNAGRSLGDEPLWVAQMVRSGIAVRATRVLERTLAQADITEARLTAVQTVLEAETRHPTLLLALRGTRAITHHSFELIETGKASLAQALTPSANFGPPPTVTEEVKSFLGRPAVKPAHAWMLRHLTRAVEIAKDPGVDPESAVDTHLNTFADAPALARQLAPKFTFVMNVKRSRAQLACAICGLGVERYRLKHQRWPATLADVVTAGLLQAVPLDPYDGQPLRYRPTPDGVVVYSLGPAGHGDGDALERMAPDDNDRIEFRLWHAETRR
jgi:hypothetical protein